MAANASDLVPNGEAVVDKAPVQNAAAIKDEATNKDKPAQEEPVIDYILQDLTDDQLLKLRDVWVELGKLTDPAVTDAASTKRRDGLSAEEVHSSLWGNVKAEDPDQLIVRYLRFGHWKVDTALGYTMQSVLWRRRNQTDSSILRGGEAQFAEMEKNGATAADREFGKQVLDQMRSGKSFLRGVDKDGRPIVFVRPRFHKASAQSPKALERYIVYHSETMRMMLRPPHTGVTAILDLRGFSMANMDWQILKLGIGELSIMYAEGVEKLYICNSPWIINGIWWTVKGWLNPVIKERITFLSSLEQLAPQVDLSKLPSDTGGSDGWSYSYIEPRGKPGPMKSDDAARDAIIAERKTLLDAYEAQTRSMHGMDVAGLRAALPERRRLAAQIRESYWRLDPYVRGESIMDRVGVIAEGGEYRPWNWDPKE